MGKLNNLQRNKVLTGRNPIPKRIRKQMKAQMALGHPKSIIKQARIERGMSFILAVIDRAK